MSSEADGRDTAFGGLTFDTGARRFCTFKVGPHLYGVDIASVKEINRGVAITPIFHAPQEVAGYVNIRGNIHLVLDMRRMLGLPEGQAPLRNTVVIFKSGVGERLGVLVDALGDVVETGEETIENPIHAELAATIGDDRSIAVKIINGVCRLKSAILMLIDPKRLTPIIEKLVSQDEATARLG